MLSVSNLAVTGGMMAVEWNAKEALPKPTPSSKSMEERFKESYPHQLSRVIEANRAVNSPHDSSPPINSRYDRNP